jgi:hypothetical protein
MGVPHAEPVRGIRVKATDPGLPDRQAIWRIGPITPDVVRNTRPRARRKHVRAGHGGGAEHCAEQLVTVLVPALGLRGQEHGRVRLVRSAQLLQQSAQRRTAHHLEIRGIAVGGVLRGLRQRLGRDLGRGA